MTMISKLDIKEIVEKKQSIIEIFKIISESQVNGCLQISDGLIEYFCYFHNGSLIYSTNSISPFERLKRNLHRLTRTSSTLSSTILLEGINKFGSHLHDSSGIPIDYQCISWFYQNNYINLKETKLVCARIIYEVYESLLSYRGEFYSDFIVIDSKMTKLCLYKVSDLINYCQERIQAWQMFRPQIYSSYQRPLFCFDPPETNNVGLAENQTLFRLLKGLSFRQLAALVDKDEILIAKILYPSITSNKIILQKPKLPFARLPKIPDREFQIQSKKERSINLKLKNNPGNNNIIHKTWNIACIGESIKIQYQINYFLDKQVFAVFSFEDPSIALKNLADLAPDLILLDINLEEINSYELCNILKNEPQFRKVPIIILSEQKGLINRTKAKLVGADAYITKPLNRSDLLATILKYLDCD